MAFLSGIAEAATPAELIKAKKYAEMALIEVKKSQTQDLAVSHIGAALAIDDTNSDYWAIKANCLSVIGEDDEALKAIDRAIKLNSHNGDMWSLRAEMLMSLRRRQEAIESAARALQNHPSQHEILRLSNTYTGLQMPVEARRLLDGLIKARPDDEVLRTRRAVCSTTLHDWDMVIEDISVGERHGNHHFSQTQNLLSRANAYFHKKLYDKAIADYKTVLRSIPDDRIAHQGLLDTYKAMGDKADARKEEVYLKGLDLDYRPM